MDKGSIPSENEDLVDALRRHHEILRWETDLLRSEITSRNLATTIGKKAYLKRHDSDGVGRSISTQLVEQMSLQKIKELRPVSPRDLLLHKAHKLAYRIQSLKKEFSATIPMEKLRLFHLLSQECLRISETIATHGSPISCESSEDAEISLFKERRIGWESTWGSPVFRCGSFTDITTLSPVYSTHSAPRVIESSRYITKALQIYSFKIFDLNDNLKWPLCVRRGGCSRHHLEVELKIKCGTDRSQDKALISATNHYTSRGDVAFFLGRSCSAESSLETLPRAVQAIILSIRVVGVSTFSVDPTCEQVVLFESAKKIPKDGGYLTLSRKVVSVGLQGALRVVIQAYGGSDRPSVSGLLYFCPKYCRVSWRACFVCGSEVELTVAWSWLVQDKMDIL
ncbi:hypothetical protein VPH35_041529 [Triticum aestivum]